MNDSVMIQWIQWSLHKCNVQLIDFGQNMIVYKLVIFIDNVLKCDMVVAVIINTKSKHWNIS